MNRITIVLLCLFCPLALASSEWPGFRGDGSGRTDALDLPLSWQHDENVAWRVDLPGYGQSSPIIWGDHVYITSVEGEKKNYGVVHPLDLESGSTVWSKQFESSQTDRNNHSISRAAPTAVADADGLVVFFESGDLIGLTHGGEVRWSRSLTKEYGKFISNHGLGSSLIQTESTVFLQVDHTGPSYLLAVDKATGSNVWKTERPSRLSWTSPVLARVHERTVIFTSSNGNLASYDAESGRELWSLDGISGNTIPSPAVHGDIVVVGAVKPRGASEGRSAEQSNCAIRLIPSADGLAYELLWEGEDAVADYASPVVHNDYVYLVTQEGKLLCRSLATGEFQYAEDVPNCWATPIVTNDRVYVFGKNGEATVVATGPAFQRLSQNSIWEEDAGKEHTVYGAAAVNGSIVLRTGTVVICLRQVASGN